MNRAKLQAALREGHITASELAFGLLAIKRRDAFRKVRNAVLILRALYDGIEVTQGVFRPLTLQEIASGLTRERARQILNATDSYPHILEQRAERERLYRQALKAARVYRVFRSGRNKGRVRPEYTAYRSMLQRCFNERNPNYPRYGGRGVVVCTEWLGASGYETFIRQMGNRPRRKHFSGKAVYSIHRIDNAPVYSASTCKWATQRQQCAAGQRSGRSN